MSAHRGLAIRALHDFIPLVVADRTTLKEATPVQLWCGIDWVENHVRHEASVRREALSRRPGRAGRARRAPAVHVNFYGHAEHAQAYLDEHPELTGRVLDQSAAVELAGGVFGGLLRNPV